VCCVDVKIIDLWAVFYTLEKNVVVI